MVQPTVINPITQQQFAARILNEFPYPWSGDQAKAVGGVIEAVFEAIGNQDTIIQADLVYGFNASRIATATDIELDLVGRDFYGDSLPREPGEPDASYRYRIQSGFFQPKVTRPAIIALLEALTGTVPRVIEPWNVSQTGAWDWMTSGWDADSVDTPSLWGDPSLRYQGFIEVQLPAIIPSQQAGNIYGWDAGAGWDIQTGVWWAITNGVFLTDNILDQLILNSAAFGVTVYRKYFPTPSGIRTCYRLAILSGSTSFSSQIQIGPYVIYGNASWNANVALTQKAGSQYTLSYSTAAPLRQMIQVIISPITANGASSIGINSGITSYSMTVPPGYIGCTPLIQPSWNTDLWITNRTGNTYTVNFSTPAPVGAFLDVQYAPLAQSGSLALQTGQQNVGLPISSIANNVIIAVPSYNTSCAIVVGSNVSVNFDVDAPANQNLYYAVIPIGNP